MNFLKLFVVKTLSLIRLDFLYIVLSKNGYFISTGWLKSFFYRKIIDRNNMPIPWWTYSSIKFVDQRLTKDMEIFEFGAGFSSLWLSKRVKSITAIENNKEWLDYIKKKNIPNIELIYSDTNNRKYVDIAFLPIENNEISYGSAISKTNKKFDIIIIDGVDRNKSIKYAIDSLKINGVIIIDNLEYSDKITEALLLLKDFKSLEFWGLAPSVSHESGTGIFYRENNCLSI